jgi:hypothetical protein
MIRNAAGKEVPHDFCECWRHKQEGDERCCGLCQYADPFGDHTVACNIRQQAFPDTRRGCSVAPDAAVLRVRSMNRTGTLLGRSGKLVNGVW